MFSACKESSVQWPGASGFCYRASENLFLTGPMGKFFEEFKSQKNCKINPAHQNVFGAS